MQTIFALIFWISFLLLFWVYFGYPLVIFLWAKFYSRPVQKAAITPSLTLLIPVYNEGDVIRQKLENSISLDYPADRFEVLVVNDGSDDDTPEILEEFASRGVKVIHQPQRQGKMAGVNTGFEHASGEIVVLSDASPIYETDALRLLVESFADETVGVVVGTLATRDAGTGVSQNVGLYWRYESALRRWESKTGSTVAVHGNMFAIRKSCFRPLSAGTINDEFSLAMETIRQGLRVVYEPDAISYDDASASMEDEVKRRSRINAGRYQALFSSGYVRMPNLNTAFRQVSHKLMRPLAPIFMILMLVANTLALTDAGDTPHLLWLRGWWGVLIWLGQVAFYALAVLGWRAERSERGRSRLLSVPYFFVSTNLAALVGLARWISGAQRVTWQKRSRQS